MIELLIAGGTGTTASLVGQTLVWLHEHQDVRRQLIDHPDLLPRAVEEFLRYYVIDTERLEPYVRQGVNAGYRQIPARFTPGPRRGADASPLVVKGCPAGSRSR